MKRRSYKYYMIVHNLGREDEAFIRREMTLENAERRMEQYTRSRPVGTYYVVELSVVTKIECSEVDKEQENGQ